MPSAQLVSVIIPTQNRCDLLAKAVASAAAQTHSLLEIIVIDNGSSDGTKDLMADLLKKEPRLIYLREEKNLGGGGARNLGLEKAQGAYVAYLDDDDEWMPDKIAKQLYYAELFPQAAAYSCGWQITGTKWQRKPIIPEDLVNFNQICERNFLGGASMLFARTDTLRQLGGFDPTIPSCQDWDLWAKLAQRGAIKSVPMPLVLYRFHSSQITSRPMSGYKGHRRFYLRYADQMTQSTKKRLLVFVLYQRSRTHLANFKNKCFFIYLAWRFLPYKRALSLSRLLANVDWYRKLQNL